jgi:integrase
MSDVWKRCDCPEERRPKCPHPWYMKQFMWQGVPYAPNLTRHARDFLHATLTTKTTAEQLAETIRTSIRAGTYVSAKAQRTARPATPQGQTVAQLLALFDADVTSADPHTRATTKAETKRNLAAFAAFSPDKRKLVGEWQIADVQIATILAFRNSAPIVTLKNSTWAKYRTQLGVFFRWAKSEQHTRVDPFDGARLDQLRALRRGKAGKRSRRVLVAEESKLLWAAGRANGELTATRLQAIIVAAVETGMRRGELLALTRGDVDLAQRSILVRATEVGASKTGIARTLPMSQRLHDELVTLPQTDPNGDAFGRAAYLFGDEMGGRIKTIRKAWHTAVLRAHGHEPTWEKTALSAASQTKLKQIDLHFHDLRHEAGKRWLESKAFDLEQIRQMYGHTTIAQTATYLHAEVGSSFVAMQTLDAQRANAKVEAAREAARVAKTRQRPYKSHTNGKPGLSTAAGPRLVKRDKSRDGV